MKRPIANLGITFVLVVGIGLATPSLAEGPPAPAGLDPAVPPKASTPSPLPSDGFRLPFAWDAPNAGPPKSCEPSADEARKSDDPYAAVTYEVATGRVYRTPSDDPSLAGFHASNSSPSYLGLLASGAGPSSVFGPDDDRTRITPTTGFPWRTICRLNINFPTDGDGVGSGAIISPFHVLTAGHNVYDIDNNEWANTIEVIPGLDVDDRPYGHAWSTFMHSVEAYTVDENQAHDWAVLRLDRNIGNFTGWMGWWWGPPDDPAYTGILNNAGYPGWQSGHWWTLRAMYFDSDSGHSADDTTHWYNMDTTGGHSGSPVWLYFASPETWQIVSVHTCGFTSGWPTACGVDSKQRNHGSRLSQARMNLITSWQTNDPQPTDRADLIDAGDSLAGLNTNLVIPGTTWFNVWNDVRNVGTAASEGFFVTYYASTDTTITAGDQLLGDDYHFTVLPFNSLDSSWASSFPAYIPDGLYYIGWIIDSGGNVAEFDETNNVKCRTSERVRVDGTQPTATISINSGATYATSRPVTLNLTRWDGGSGVKDCRYKNVGGTWSAWQPSTTTKSWTLSSGDGTKTVYYQVRDNAGNVREVSDTIILDTTAPTNPNSLWSLSHTVGTWSSDGTIDIGWSGAQDAASGVHQYSYSWTTSSSTIPDAVAETTGTSATSPPLGTGANWYFHIRTKDWAGNWNSGAAHKGPYRIDVTDPSNPTSCTEDGGAPKGSWQRTVGNPSFTWAGATDVGSGINRYYVYWGTNPSGTSSNWTGNPAYDPPAVGNPSTNYLRVRTEDKVGHSDSWKTLFTFKYDAAPPSNPTSMWSPSHTAGAWSTDSTIEIAWSGASDGAGSGVTRYSYEWTTSPGTIPDSVGETTGTSATSPPLDDGRNWYFHIRTKDQAGNWNSDAVHKGPFRIDTTAPSNPTASSETHGAPAGTWQNSVSNPSYTWSGASDDSGSGVSRYYVYWGTDASGTSGNWTTNARYDPPAVASPSINYLRVRTEDAAGNSAPWKTLATLKYDGSPPSNPTSLWSPSHTVGTWSDDNTVDVNWSGASDDGGSGVTRYSYSWTDSSDTIPDTVGETTDTNSTSPALADGNNWYFHVRTRDLAGNWSTGAAHKGPFRLDTTPPTHPTTSIETHGAPRNTWQSTVDDPAFTWSGASDGDGSGVAGYNVYWGTDPSGTSTTYTGDAAYDPPAVSSSTSHVGPQWVETIAAQRDGGQNISAEDTYYLRVQTVDRVGHTSSWKKLFTFKYDGTAPSNPTTCTEDHGAPKGTWQNTFDDPSFTWSGASDGAGSGIGGYYVYWGTDSSGTSSYWTDDTGYDPPAVSSPSVRYLRIATEDDAGNLSDWKTLFTFKYDASPPSNPTSLWSPSHTAGAWSADNTVDLGWSGASDDGGSGVTRYSYDWTAYPDTIPDTVGETAGTSATSPPLDDGNSWYFHIRTKDQVGNWNPDAAHKGPFRIDTESPFGSLVIDHGADCINDPSVTLALSADDDLSGVSQMQLRYGSVDHDWEPFLATRTIQLGGADGPKWVSARYEDRAGNLSEWYMSTITLDRAAPTSLVEALPPEQTATSFEVTWSGQDPDPGCGISTYDVQYRAAGDSQWWDWLTDTTLVSATFGPLEPVVLRAGQTYYFRSRARDEAGNRETMHGWNGDTSTTIYLLQVLLPFVVK